MVENNYQVNENHPELIQGGMGVAVSTYRLARAVAIEGQRRGINVLGVVSGTGLSLVMASRLHKHDPDAIAALRAFDPERGQRIIGKYTRPNFKPPYKPELQITGTKEIKSEIVEETVAAAFSEVHNAKVTSHGQLHGGPVGINLLGKIELPVLPSILGAMMADVDYVIMGAGIPYQIPDVLENFANGRPATYRMEIAGSKRTIEMTLDPADFIQPGKKLKKPKFLLVASHHILPMRLKDVIDGVILEGPSAGGHNAPARGKQVNENGEPIYTEKDEPNLDKIIGLEPSPPIWLAGGYASPEKLAEAKAKGAVGVQLGSIFALTSEAGWVHSLKQRVFEHAADETLIVRTSTTASPTGFPLQIVQLPGTLSEQSVQNERARKCNLGHLVEPYERTDQSVGFRCAGGPIEAWKRAGGEEGRSEGALCGCNGLAASAGHELLAKDGSPEPMLVTFGKESGFAKLIKPRADGLYSVADVMDYMFPASKVE